MRLVFMKDRTRDILRNFLLSRSELTVVSDDIVNSMESIIRCYHAGGKVVVCGNGGSASDSEHIVGELMKGFKLKRPINNTYEKPAKNVFPRGRRIYCWKYPDTHSGHIACKPNSTYDCNM